LFVGNVPGAIAIGAIFDTACLVMQEKCDGTGSCWIYDTQFISEGIFWACVIVKSISTLGFILSLLLYKAPPHEEEVLALDGPEKTDKPLGEDNVALESSFTYM
jgi:hypothetical protein